MLLPFEPILAIGIGQIIALIVFTVSVLSWFVNIIQGNQANGGPPRPKNRPPRDPVQSELEKFLQEVVGGQQQQEKKRPAPPSPPPQKQARNVSDKKSGKNKPQQSKPTKTESAPERPGARAAQTHLQTSALGQGVRSHLSEYMEPHRVDAAVQRDIGAAVQRDIGTDATALATHRAGSIHPLVQSLRDPKGVQQAILLNEILSPPKAMRKS